MPSDNSARHSGIISVLAIFFALVVSVAGVSSPVGQMIDRWYYDSLFGLRGALAPPRKIVVVGIDEPSFAIIGAPWPWQRSLHAELVDAIDEAGARAIAFDVIFAEASAPEEDAAFAAAMRRSGKVILASVFDQIVERGYLQETLVEPTAELLESAIAVAAINLPVDPDGFVRRIEFHHDGYPYFASAIASMATPDRPVVPLPAGGRLINFYGPSRTVITVSYYQALDPAKNLPPGLLDGALVLVGLAAQAGGDIVSGRSADTFPVPFSRSGSGYMAGVEIHANTVASILSGSFIRPSKPWVIRVVALVLALVGAWISLRAPFMLGALLASGVLVSLLTVSIVAFSSWGFYIPAVVLATPLTAVFVAAMGIRYFRTWRERQFIRSTFSTYVSPGVVAQLLKTPENLRLGGELVEGTVLFTDLAGFTTISGKISPEELIGMMNRFLGAATKPILDHDGMIDKFIGDAIMAVWGVPVSDPDHAIKGCRAALAMRQAFAEVGAQEAKLTGIPITARIGVNSGEMVAGNVGGENYVNYTVLGNEVNMGARFEGINKVYGTDIIIGRNSVSAAVAAEMILRELDTIVVKGAVAPVVIYELIDHSDRMNDRLRETLDNFAEGLSLYRERHFAKARSCFETCIDLAPEDGPSLLYLSRCDEHIATPPPDSWDAIFRPDSK